MWRPFFTGQVIEKGNQEGRVKWVIDREEVLRKEFEGWIDGFGG